MSTSTTRRLFGTDGIRGVAGEAPLDAATIFAAGLAIGHSVKRNGKGRVIVGRDTRESSGWIASTIAAGIRKAKGSVESAGVVPTPAVAFLARTHGFDAGIVISASHNPWRDNGIKLFGGDGFKLPDSVELAIEDEILHHASNSLAPDPVEAAGDGRQCRSARRLHSISARYCSWSGVEESAHRSRLREWRCRGDCSGAVPADRR